MIRFSKILFTNSAKVYVSGIRCSYDNIVKIVGIFDCTHISLTVDSVARESQLLTFIKEHGLNYFIKQQAANYVELSAEVPCSLFNCILEKAICEKPENIFIFNLLDPSSWNMQLQRPFDELVAMGVTDMFISASLDEDALLISINRSLLSAKDVYKKIRLLNIK